VTKKILWCDSYKGVSRASTVSLTAQDYYYIVFNDKKSTTTKNIYVPVNKLLAVVKNQKRSAKISPAFVI